ncbi:hypothetical protein SteCoe_35762 [Stentor coeruleus]|uniref:Uncharacterized protein n=1 Tax=Stentor coeruleus TaxID=5963 RepID=A0A1R2ARL8_9CILI|nr:hypothetical protein SteCoe_35762 [Stentor coeruleus]
MRLPIIFIIILGLTSACPAGDFYMGLIEGFESDPDLYGNCGNNLVLLGDQIGLIIPDIEKYLQETPGSLTKLIQDIQAFITAFESTPSNCDFSAFAKAFLQFTTEEGRKSIFQNYLNNAAEINSLSLNVESCETDYKLCGSSIGTMLRLLTGANLQQGLRGSLEITSNDILNFFQGLASSYAGHIASTPLCKGNVLRLMPDLNKLVNELKLGVVNYDYLMVGIEYTVLRTCWRTDWSKSYSLNALINFAKIAFDVTAWELSYFMNTEAINGFLNQIKNCSQNYNACGQAVTSVLALNKPWVGYDHK